MKIKILDLLNKITKNEEVPLKIKYDGVIWDYNKDGNDYYSDEWLFGSYLWREALSEFYDDEIEIIEEEKKIELPKKLNCQDEWEYSKQYLADKIDELIDYLKYKEEERKLSQLLEDIERNKR